ncbi:MAG TPA: 1-deoxy-D-xylulose-5-phosphate synthase [Candidatus Merdiplasma excrementigallinarum]|uniref:1-deoxy-D-xylulose-5-phosphate synthase n=1 Tax=Candidatus Merdiplasma excrementigallinarum TaxID=2840864 RepID=A0A9D1NZ05_9FIRM|nr:1-deoxy-D-xylulose-5-phosphate synthase [Candidatus Merdiplasma excrementigallinarum]
MVLEKINQSNDIKKIEKDELPLLAEEIRQFLIEKISVTGGHLASNLGVVELTMALHLAFQLPEDKMIWDVGHQSYTHKILTGRRDGFDELRKYGGMSGFPKRKESSCDAFDTGHSSTSISAGLGYARARDLLGEKYAVISIIGDGALTGGMAYEALNNAAQMKTNFIIILNDNEMSISENVGGLSTYLSNLRTADAYTGLKAGLEKSLNRIPVYGSRMVERIRMTKNGIKQLIIPGMFFEDLGVKYLGPLDGHNIAQMVRVFQEARRVNGAVVIHVKTKKGKGYLPAEKHPARFHGAEPFDIETGLPRVKKRKANYTDVFSTVMCKMGAREPRMAAITAAMPDGTGLKRFRNMYPDRFFDVGIAEEHAVTFAAGMAVAGMIPVVAVYSSFLQRAYDQIIHDVCIQNLHVIFAVDRAGLVGSDGETHQGIFDLSYLSSIPNMCVMAPKNKWELSDMLKFAIRQEGPVAIRYPRGEAFDGLADFRAPITAGKGEVLYDECGIALLAVGSMVKTALEVRARLRDLGYSCSLINARFVKPLDEELIRRAAREHDLLVTMEENVRSGGFGDRVLEYLSDIQAKVPVINVALPDDYIEHGNVEVLKKETCVDADSIVKRILAAYVGMRQEGTDGA